MALTPEDVVNKRFQPTKFREGYDQDEVDDFLDEVVVELRRLTPGERGAAGSVSRVRRRRAASAGRARVAAAAAAAAAPGRRRASPSPCRSPRSPVARPAPRRLDDPPAPTTCSSWRAACTRSTSVKASRSATRSSPRATPRRPASSPRPRPSSARRSSILDEERSALEHRIDELRTFEREYRQKLESYIEGQLRELDANGGPGLAGHGLRLRDQREVQRLRSCQKNRQPKLASPSVRALVVVAVLAGGVYALDQFTKYLVVTNLPLGEQVPVLGELLHSAVRQEPRRGVLARQRQHLDLLDRRLRRHRLHHLVRPPHPVDRLGGRLRAAARRRTRQPHRPAVPRAGVRARPRHRLHLEPWISRRSSTSPTSASSSSMGLFIILTMRGSASTARGPCRRRMPRATRTHAERALPRGVATPIAADPPTGPTGRPPAEPRRSDA